MIMIIIIVIIIVRIPTILVGKKVCVFLLIPKEPLYSTVVQCPGAKLSSLK